MLQEEMLIQQKTIKDLKIEGQRMLDQTPSSAADSSIMASLNALSTQSTLIDSQLKYRLQQLTDALTQVTLQNIFLIILTFLQKCNFF